MIVEYLVFGLIFILVKMFFWVLGDCSIYILVLLWGGLGVVCFRWGIVINIVVFGRLLIYFFCVGFGCFFFYEDIEDCGVCFFGVLFGFDIIFLGYVFWGCVFCLIGIFLEWCDDFVLILRLWCMLWVIW